MTSGRASGLPVIMDVDTGIDDAMALAFAAGSAGLDLLAVTTVAGNVDVYQATANTRNVLSFLGREDVPVHRGATHALTRSHRPATHVHGEDGLGGAELPASSRQSDVAPGPATIVRLARERPGELTLIAVGPLTNLAIALNVEPRIAEMIPRVVVMGGAYHVPGNITPHAEFNLWEDPEAAAQVFVAGFEELTLIGLDVTLQVGLSQEIWRSLAQRTDRTAPAELAFRLGRTMFRDEGRARMELHDPLAVAVVLDPTLVSGELVAVSVTTTGEQHGQTTVAGPGRAMVATEVRSEYFMDRFHSALDLV